jgi:hypothetical protein
LHGEAGDVCVRLLHLAHDLVLSVVQPGGGVGASGRLRQVLLAVGDDQGLLHSLRGTQEHEVLGLFGGHKIVYKGDSWFGRS